MAGELMKLDGAGVEALVVAGAVPGGLLDICGELGLAPGIPWSGSVAPQPRSTLDRNPAHEEDGLFVHRAAPD